MRAVASRADLRRFRKAPRTICEGFDWVPPLKIMDRWILNRRRHPFYEGGKSAEAEFFLARDTAGRVVGRIAAIINHTYDQHAAGREGDAAPCGFFGFFDCVNSPAVAAALLDAAGDWLRRRGVRRMLGPASPSQAYEYGVLVEGHHLPHRFLLAHNPPYYGQLLEQAGLVKAKDLLTWSLELQGPRFQRVAEAFFALSDAAQASVPDDVKVRAIDKRKIDAEVLIACGLINRVLREHWGYSPITDGELGYMARSLRPFLMPEAILIAEQGGQPIGVALAVPDLNELIAKLRCRWTWIEPIELLLRARRWKPRCVHVVSVGVLPEYDRAGVALAMVGRLGRNLIAKGVQYAEAHLVLEDNFTIRNPLRRYGFEPTRTHRIYRRDL